MTPAAPRVALVRPLYGHADPEFQEPLGAEAICGFLREKKLEARGFDRLLGVGISEIDAWNPDWIGFSLMTDSDVPDALRLQQLLERDGRRFFAGGLFVTTCPERARALFPSETVLVSGEGEGPVWELVTTGAVQGRCHPGPDEWAQASRDDLSAYLERGGVINIRSSRGCLGSCAFCTTPQFSACPGRHEARSIEKIADEMEGLIRSGFPPVFNFTDDMFGDHRRIEALVRQLRERNLRAAFSLEMRAGEVVRTPAGLWPVLHEGGLCRVFTGLESLDPATLACWRKPVPLDAFPAALQALRESGIACETGYILWHDRTTPDTARREAAGLHRLDVLSPKSALSRLVLFPGSMLHSRRKAEGITLCPLQPDARLLLSRWETLLKPLFPLWTAASCAYPARVCRSFLHPEEQATLRALSGCLRTIRELTWQSLSADILPSAEECSEIRRELLALHITGSGSL